MVCRVFQPELFSSLAEGLIEVSPCKQNSCLNVLLCLIYDIWIKYYRIECKKTKVWLLPQNMQVPVSELALGTQW